MMDIVKAMAAEAKYIEDRMNRLDVVLDLTEYGFPNLEDYFEAKRRYLIKQANTTIYDTDMTNISERVEASILAGESCLYLPTASSTYAWHGNDDIDRELCTELGVEIYDMHYTGGTIIGGPEDLSMLLALPTTIDIAVHHILNRLAQMFINNGLNAVVDNNDILVDGIKVLGAMERTFDNLYVFACQISFTDHTELINQICQKDSYKIPGYLTTSQIARETIKNEVIRWLR